MFFGPIALDSDRGLEGMQTGLTPHSNDEGLEGHGLSRLPQTAVAN